MQYLSALWCAAAHGFERGGGGGDEGGGGAADAGGAWNPCGVVAGVNSQEQRLRWCPDLRPHNVGRVLSHGPARGDGHDAPGHGG